MIRNPRHSDENSDNVPVTWIVRSRIREGYEEDFIKWSRSARAACSQFKGYAGTRIIHPPSSGGEHVAIITFDSYTDFLAWEKSEERKYWLDQVQEFIESDQKGELLEGLNYWIEPDGKGKRPWPPDFRMVVVAYFAIWPVVYFVRPLLLEHLPDNPLLASAVSTAVISLIMGYVSLPLMVRLFRKWLPRD